jgi:hypothetical protein
MMRWSGGYRVACDPVADGKEERRRVDHVFRKCSTMRQREIERVAADAERY